MKRNELVVIGSCLVFFIPNAFADNGNADADSSSTYLSASSGYDFTTGKYGKVNRTTLWSIPTTVSLNTDHYSVDLTVPYLWQHGPTGKAARVNGVLVVPLRADIRTVSGIGDTTLSLTRFFDSTDESDDATSFDIKSLVKFGTADPTYGLGTGKNDYSFQGDISQPLGATTWTFSLGYTVIGKPSNTLMNNIFFGSIDGTYKLNDTNKLGLTFDIAQSSTAGIQGTRDITLHYTHKFTKTSRLQMYALKGLSDASPNWGTGATLGMDF